MKTMSEAAVKVCIIKFQWYGSFNVTGHDL